MALLGNLIARSLKLRKQFTLPTASPRAYQRHVLRHLLDRGQYTLFGKHYGFDDILKHEVDFIRAFQERVPPHDYDKMWDEWWSRTQQGVENVSWPGKVKYYALSSGTSGSASKHIPVTADTIKSIKRMGFKQLYSMVNFQVNRAAFGKGILMLGGTTSLFERGDFYEGDMSGISVKNMPRWASSLLYKPGQKISKTPQWEERIRLIIRKARQWDVGTVCGVPAWVQLVFEEIIRHHKVKTIHDIWPNLSVYIHGGVSFEPYREHFKKLLGRPLTYIETYMASEGSFGFQARPTGGIKLVLNNGNFFEFVPFNEETFDENGSIVGNPRALLVDEVKEGVDYAVMLSTPSGAWRYLIGDVVRFTSAAEYEIAIVGRTRQFLSIAGEHMSVENMNEAIARAQKSLGITVREFTVSGYREGDTFAHRWAIGCDDDCAHAEALKTALDAALRDANDDYAVARDSALRTMHVDVYPASVFYDYLKSIGKHGGMSKFPRVLKGSQLKSWNGYLEESGNRPASAV